MFSSLFRKRAASPPPNPEGPAATSPSTAPDIADEGWRPDAHLAFEPGAETELAETPLPAAEVQPYAFRWLDRYLSEALARHREQVWAEKEADLREWRPRRTTQEISASLHPLGEYVLYTRGKIHPALKSALRERLQGDLCVALEALADRWRGTPTRGEVAAAAWGVVDGLGRHPH